MIDSRKLIAAFVVALVVTAAGYADMVPVSRLDAGRRQSSRVFSQANLKCTDLSNPFNYSSVADPDLWYVKCLPKANADVRQTSETLPSLSLTNGPSSFSLCLCALIGLGLCRSAPWVKRLSFGFVPELYHNGGPFQIGHSYPVTPESICPAPVYCFSQPVYTVEDSLPQYRLGIVVSLWRKSQFTPVVLAHRGPPNMS